MMTFKSMTIDNSPIEVHRHFCTQMVRLGDMIESRVNTRIAKFANPEDQMDEETKAKVESEIDKCFDEIINAITTN